MKTPHLGSDPPERRGPRQLFREKGEEAEENGGIRRVAACPELTSTSCQRGKRRGSPAAPTETRLPGRRARPGGGAGAQAPPTSGSVTMGRTAERGGGRHGPGGGGATAAAATAAAAPVGI